MIDDDVEIPEIALARIVTLPQAAKLSSLSADTLRRHYRDKIVTLSPHREGMRVRDALFLNVKKKAVRT